MDLDDRAGSHHGDPDLLNRDIRLLAAYTKWVTTARRAGYAANWLPGEVDWLKSRLFWRIRSGKEPLESPPPTCYSCPWYEVIEMPAEEHSTFEAVRIYEDEGKRVVRIAQCSYDVIKEGMMDGIENAAIVGFGPYRFKTWNADKTYKTSETRRAGFIRYLETVSVMPA
jgi:hypothetical protein